MSWLLIAIIAHFLFALVFVFDKFFISKTVLNPISYAFYTGILQIFVLILIPFGFKIPSSGQIAISFIAGALFTLAVLFLYKSFQLGEISIMTPLVGGGVPVFTLILNYSFLGERLSFDQLIAFFLLVLGGVVIIWPRKSKLSAEKKKTSLSVKLTLALLAAFLFASSFVLTKFIFDQQSFISGFIWIRIGGFLMAVLFLFWPGNYQKIFRTTKSVRTKTAALFVSNKLLSSLAFILLNYAIFLGKVTLVNALQGVQYAFLLVLAVVLSIKFPQFLKEQISQGAIIQKIIAILLISFGLAVLAF